MSTFHPHIHTLLIALLESEYQYPSLNEWLYTFFWLLFDEWLCRAVFNTAGILIGGFWHFVALITNNECGRTYQVSVLQLQAFGFVFLTSFTMHKQAESPTVDVEVRSRSYDLGYLSFQVIDSSQSSKDHSLLSRMPALFDSTNQLISLNWRWIIRRNRLLEAIWEKMVSMIGMRTLFCESELDCLPITSNIQLMTLVVQINSLAWDWSCIANIVLRGLTMSSERLLVMFGTFPGTRVSIRFCPFERHSDRSH
jgi:hypothetical protein